MQLHCQRNGGFRSVLFKGEPITLRMPLDSYVMENILFKISFPAEFHAQTAVECAFTLHPEVKDRLDEIERIEMETQEPGVRIIDKTGPLNNFADRDHCLQYMAAIGLIFGELTAEHYTDGVAADPRIDTVAAKMVVRGKTSRSPRITTISKNGRSVTAFRSFSRTDEYRTRRNPIPGRPPKSSRRRNSTVG